MAYNFSIKIMSADKNAEENIYAGIMCELRLHL